MRDHNYFVYMTTNSKRKVLYTGMTNDLYVRMIQHFEESKNERKSFAGKYYCYNLIYYERYQYVHHAIEREKEIKGWTRIKKEALINEFNPKWQFLNDQI